MPENRMILIGEKETFIARVLIKKAQEADVDCRFVQWTIDDINKNIDDAALIVLFMEDGEQPAQDVLHFLSDTMEEKGLQMIIVGEQNDVDSVGQKVSRALVYTVFPRPVDNNVFMNTVSEYIRKVSSGEFKKSLLVVDDDPQYLTLVREWLKNDYKVSMVSSGLQAIKWLGKNKVDLILLDYEMPVTTGPQVLEMLRSDPETSPIPVMFLTSKGDKESVMKVLALKPEGYFLKNIEKDELLEKLQEFFILHKN